MAIDMQKILAACDHTLLKQGATWDDIKALCDDAIEFGTASVCIPPCYVRAAKDYVGDRLKICTVIGFPNGNMTTATKVYETRDALLNGASEIDMVINIGMLKAGERGYVLNEIQQIKAACDGWADEVGAAEKPILKVIVETCLLTEEEKVEVCGIVTDSGADFIKTSTGFSTGGATFEDIALFAEHVGPGVQIKASGGISSFADAERFMELGATRLGTSRLVRLAREAKKVN